MKVKENSLPTYELSLFDYIFINQPPSRVCRISGVPILHGNSKPHR